MSEYNEGATVESGRKARGADRRRLSAGGEHEAWLGVSRVFAVTGNLVTGGPANKLADPVGGNPSLKHPVHVLVGCRPHSRHSQTRQQRLPRRDVDSPT